jgi:zinc-ribbon domain
MKRPHWRKMTWVLIVWSVLILIWAIAGGAGNDCGSETTQLNKEACEAGTGIGVALILLIGFFGFAFFSLIWFMTRPKGRVCPACGENVKKGRTACPKCGHDFAAAAQTVAAPAPPAEQPPPA